MHVSPTGASEYHDGNEVGRYGRALGSNEIVFVQYHDGIAGMDEPAWAMDTDVEWKISISVDTILVADANDNGLYIIDREAFTKNQVEIAGRGQYVARASDDFVTYVGDPDDHLRGNLWVTAANGHGGYHKDKNEA